ncbi:MAG: CDP-glycerol glycerophosphotransferase family protein [Lachnospiraceae bacterium]|nr:CDP-glycerol glycerophosphotransferase family protein [Lachnospiraceae bacterium]
MKELGYHLFAILYRIFSAFSLKDNRVFLIMTHDAGPTGNLAVMRDYMKSQKDDYIFYELRRSDTHFGKSLKKAFKFFFVDSYRLARSKYVLMDNMFLPFAFIKVKKGCKVIQLWHGTGVIKKIGFDANKGRLKELETMANAKTSQLIVSSKTTKKIYSGSFQIPENKVYITGMPRADVFFKGEDYIAKEQENFYKDYPKLRDKKLVLYAPTFRDKDAMHPKLLLDVNRLAAELPEGYILGVRLHPFVAKAFEKERGAELNKNVINLSAYPKLNTLLFSTDILISDYSSIVFEYAVLKRPMAFYVPDLAEFSDSGRGFYHDYESYVPGPVIKTEDDLIAKIRYLSNLDNEDYDKLYHRDDFIKDTYEYQDDKSSKRVYKLITD